MRPRVYSRRKGADPIPDGAVYVGRPTQFGNPFACFDRSREEHARVVGEYRRWIASDDAAVLRARARRELVGKDLVCWCRCPSDSDPLPCHAEVLLWIANAETDETLGTAV